MCRRRSRRVRRTPCTAAQSGMQAVGVILILAGVLPGLRRPDGHGSDLQHRAGLPEAAGQKRRHSDVLDERPGRRDVLRPDLRLQRARRDIHGRQQARLPERRRAGRECGLAARAALDVLCRPDLHGHRPAAGGQHRLCRLPAARLHDGARRISCPVSSPTSATGWPSTTASCSWRLSPAR